MYRLVEVEQHEASIGFRFADFQNRHEPFVGFVVHRNFGRYSIGQQSDSVWATADEFPMYSVPSWMLYGGIVPMEFSYGMPMEYVVRGIGEVIGVGAIVMY